MAMPRILMTGATGSFGRYVAAELLEGGCELMVLVRGGDEVDARRRAHETMGLPQGRLSVLHGDVTAEGLGLTRAGRAAVRTADIVLHAAAATDCGLDLDAARRVNFEGTRNLLGVAHRIPKLQKLVHISTAFVAGKRCGHVLEPQLEHAGFVNAYERSKYEGERLVRAHSQVLPVAVVRPSIVAGVAGVLQRILEEVGAGRLPVLPGRPWDTLDVIGAADAGAATAQIVLARGALGTFHVASGDRAPRVADILRLRSHRRVRFVEPAHFGSEPEALRWLEPQARGAHDVVANFVETLAYPKTFDTARAEAVLGRHPCSGDPLRGLAELSAQARSVIGG